ncbi:MAG: hypothetical protein OXH00_24095 [Candidatus Poribacteria bacterium]|nr:hypothetical protein [Candidatus Poribacteria bacterium]
MIVDTDIQHTEVKVVNVGGPLDNFITPRSQRQDFRHVDLNHGPNTIVANVNEVQLRDILGTHVRFLRASNVPFVPVPTGAFVEPNAFIKQAQSLQVKRIVITTGQFSELAISNALNKAGFSVQRRVIHQRTFITARC